MAQLDPQSIIIIGSLNMDFIARVATLPVSGATVQGKDFKTLPGGKGANQAFTVGKLGGHAIMVGCVGADHFGAELKNNLAAVGVNTAHIQTVTQTSTGVALIEVEQSGQNTIVVVAGANEQLSAATVEKALAHYKAGILLLQLETPLATVTAAAVRAKRQGMTVILDPAPAQHVSRDLLQNVDILTPNESEALFLLQKNGAEIALTEAPEIACALLTFGVGQVILKLGAKGAFWANAKQQKYFPTREIQAVDATAAGDCFNGAFAVALAEGKGIDAAIAFANGAAGIAVTRLGAQASIPDREAVEKWLHQH